MGLYNFPPSNKDTCRSCEALLTNQIQKVQVWEEEGSDLAEMREKLDFTDRGLESKQSKGRLTQFMGEPLQRGTEGVYFHIKSLGYILPAVP